MLACNKLMYTTCSFSKTLIPVDVYCRNIAVRKNKYNINAAVDGLLAGTVSIRTLGNPPY